MREGLTPGCQEMVVLSCLVASLRKQWWPLSEVEMLDSLWKMVELKIKRLREVGASEWKFYKG